MHNIETSIRPDGEIDPHPKVTYGKGQVLLRIGNGGAGATGLIEALANDFLSTQSAPRSITWVCNHSRNTQLALHRGYIDLALTYERDQERIAQSEGWSKTAGCVFHDHFVLAGPVGDPAGLKSATSLLDALTRIAKHKALFHSRVDGSATMWKEQSLWSRCGLAPWKNKTESDWYKTSHVAPAEALKAAAYAGAYLLTDRSTLLAQTGLRTISNMTVFFEPTSSEDLLMNSCYALRSSFATGEKLQAIRCFIEYMLSSRGQAVINSYGRDRCGLPLFATLDDNFAKTRLAGGCPKDGRWIMLSKL